MPSKKTSSFIERYQRRAARRAGRRGAGFVEAVVVISTLTLGLVALMYVRDLYVKQLGAARLTRAAVIAHSMAGCKTNQPRDWLAKDLDGYTTGGTTQDQQSARGRENGSTASGTGTAKADKLVQR